MNLLLTILLSLSLMTGLARGDFLFPEEVDSLRISNGSPNFDRPVRGHHHYQQEPHQFGHHGDNDYVNQLGNSFGHGGGGSSAAAASSAASGASGGPGSSSSAAAAAAAASAGGISASAAASAASAASGYGYAPGFYPARYN